MRGVKAGKINGLAMKKGVDEGGRAIRARSGGGMPSGGGIIGNARHAKRSGGMGLRK